MPPFAEAGNAGPGGVRSDVRLEDPMLDLRALAPLPSLLEDDPPRRVLLVEDDPLQARALRRLFESCGLTCHLASTVPEALEAIARQPAFDIIVSDLALPGPSGLELSRRLRGPLLIAYSGSAGRAPGFDVQVEKPRVRELLGLLRGRRLAVVTVALGEGGCLACLPGSGLSFRAPTPAQALRALAAAVEHEL